MGYRYGAKDIVEEYRCIDARRWAQEGILTRPYYTSWQWTRNGERIARINVCGSSDGREIELSYRVRQYGGEWKDMCYKIRIDWTPCHFGGYRAWFICPRCGRRVAKLYNSTRFICRHCLQLAYECQREKPLDRLCRKLDKVKAKIGGEPGLFNTARWGNRPKGMHRKTYRRIYKEMLDLEDQANLGLHQWVMDLSGSTKRLGDRLGLSRNTLD